VKVETSSVISIRKRTLKSSIFETTKRTIDIVGAIVGIMITLPIMLFFLGFYLVGPNKGPMIFKQRRLGKYGEVFYLYKFRSMVLDAEKKLKENQVLYHRYVNNNYKLDQDEDPRITPFGKFIRKTSLDELPQFVNVLKGEMSLVGPRPIVPEELKEYDQRKEDFLSVKPGLTGYWQVCGRSNLGYPDRVDIELFYIYNKSILLDMNIVLKTFLRVIGRNGAF
jgi:exopolysaccharide production protein ExoY